MLGHRRTDRILALGLILGCLGLAGCGSQPRTETTPNAAGPPTAGEPRPADRTLERFAFADDRVFLVEAPVAAAGQDPEPLLRAARRQLDAGKLAGALETLSRAVAAAPDDAEVYAVLGQALVRTQPASNALAAFRHALSLDPDDAEARCQLGLRLQALGRRREAVAAWRDLVARHPDHGPAHRRLAALLYLLGDEDGARRELAEAETLGELGPAQLPSLLAGQRRAAPPKGPAAVPTVGPPRRVDSGESWAVEPTIAVGPAPDQVIAAWVDAPPAPSDQIARVAIAQSFDGGRTWDEHAVETPEPIRRRSEGDPIIAVDRFTGDVWVSGLSVADAVFVTRRPPLATTFEDPRVVREGEFVLDKPVMTAATSPFFPDERRLYVVHNQGLQVSADRGETWADPIPMGGFLGYHPAVAPNGVLYIVYADDEGGIWLARSFDQGATVRPGRRIATRLDFWDTFGDHEGRFPGSFRVVQFPVLAIDPSDGTLYCAYLDTTEVVDGEANVDVYLIRSSDGGDTWTAPHILNHDGDPSGDQFFPWLDVDATGRVHAIYYDTRHGAQPDGAETAFIDATYAFSDDQGDTWTEVRLTPESFDGSTAWIPGFQFIGDYLGIATRATATGSRTWAIYMSTIAGDSDIYVQTIDFGDGGGGGEATCVPDATSLCLQDARFRVRAEWEDQRGQSGEARAQALTPDTGYFWFFSPSNVELTVKVLDGCGIADHYWVFAAGMTNVGVRMTVEDTETGEVRVYENRLGDPFQPVLDTSAFATCPEP